MDNAFLFPTAVEDFYTWNKDARFGEAAAIAFSPTGWSTIAGTISRDGAKAIKRKDVALLTDVTADVDATKKQKVLAEAEVVGLKAQLEEVLESAIRVAIDAKKAYEQAQEEFKRVQEESKRAQEELRRENEIAQENLRRAYEQAQEESKRENEIAQENLRKAYEQAQEESKRAQEESKRAYQQAREELKTTQAEFLNAIKAGVKGLEHA